MATLRPNEESGIHAGDQIRRLTKAVDDDDDDDDDEEEEAEKRRSSRK